MPAKPIFVGGTASHAGKSWMATAICRYLFRRGFRVAPFKAQNMSNNSYPCPAGGEIGRAQVAQAEACGLEPSPDFNPILLKPNSDCGSQVVVNGRAWRTLSARDYYAHFDYLLGQVLAAYARLAERFEYVVIEGAGSVAELNLAERDLVNFGLARRLGAPALLVGDIDRGGIFAALLGTVALLPPEDRALVKALAVNRFRGDPRLFDDGVRILEERSGLPCLGVFPYLADAPLDEEDGVALERPETPAAPDAPCRAAIIRFPRISNFTDFRLLPWAVWLSRPREEPFDCVFLPGTKNTLADLAWLRETGLAEWVLEQHRAGAAIVGVCGGYQMLGERIADPLGVESPRGEADGLGLLPAFTVMAAEKTTRVVNAATPSGVRFRAYEIHLGQTRLARPAPPFARLEDGAAEGVRCGRVFGTYLHGALENPAVLGEILGVTVPPPPPKTQVYDRLGEWFSTYADTRRFAELYL
jgi:adenosylcobyric acid synthase